MFVTPIFDSSLLEVENETKQNILENYSFFLETCVNNYLITCLLKHGTTKFLDKILKPSIVLTAYRNHAKVIHFFSSILHVKRCYHWS